MNYAVKHGVTMEPHAKNMFVRLMKYIAATPDLVSMCQCCGTGVCELKHPWNYRDKVTSHHNLAHLSRGVNDDTSMLLPNSSYMFQLQGQMACLGVEHGYFFVYSSHSYHLECVTFNEELLGSMVERYKFVWQNYVAPELLTGAMIPIPSRCTFGRWTCLHWSTNVQTCKYCVSGYSRWKEKCPHCIQVTCRVFVWHLCTWFYGGTFLFVTAQHRMHKM